MRNASNYKFILFSWLLICNSMARSQSFELFNAQKLDVDMSARFLCMKTSSDTVERDTQKFFLDNDFRYINKSSAAKSLNEFSPFETDIIGIRGDKTIIDIKKFRGEHESYFISILTPPPTIHNDSLEKKFFEFVTNSLNCQLNKTVRHNNSAASISLFDEIYIANKAIIDKFAPDQ